MDQCIHFVYRGWTADHADQEAGAKGLLQIASGRGNQSAPHWLPGGLKAAPALVEVLAAAPLATGAVSLGTPTL